MDFDGLKIAMIPWVCSENQDEILNFLKTCNAPIVAGHFELNGYEVFRGVSCSGGMDDDVFSRFEKVLSGHLKDKMVKLSYSSDDDRTKIDSLVKKIEDQNPYDFTIVENFVSGLSQKTNVDLSMDTLSIITDEIENLELDINKDEIKKLTHKIYMEALEQ